MRPPGAAPPPGRAGHPPGCPGLRLRLHLGSEPSFCCRIFCYIFARIIPAPYLAILCVFFLGLFLPGQKLLLAMSSCDSSGEDYMGRRLRQLQQDYNQRKYVGCATEEEIAARKAEMEHSVRREVKIVTAQQGGPSNPIMVGFVQPQYDLSLKLAGTA